MPSPTASAASRPRNSRLNSGSVTYGRSIARRRDAGARDTGVSSVQNATYWASTWPASLGADDEGVADGVELADSAAVGDAGAEPCASRLDVHAASPATA